MVNQKQTFRPRRRFTGSVYADFGFSINEFFCCALCQVKAARTFLECGFTLSGYSVPISAHCPIAGVVGLCQTCREMGWSLPDIFKGKPYPNFKGYSLHELTWAPPALLAPIKHEPIYIIKRGFCDEQKLCKALSCVWNRIPARAQAELRRYLTRVEETSALGDLAKGAMRMEALPNWPGRAVYHGQCFNSGHAIRLHSVLLDVMPKKVIETLVAHEMGHSVLFARMRRSRHVENSEEAVIRLIASWGYRDADFDEWSGKHKMQRWKARYCERIRKEQARSGA